MKACMVTNRRQEGKRRFQRRSQQLQRRGREREIENTQGLVLIVALVQSMLQILLLVHLIFGVGSCWDPQDSVLHDGRDEEGNNLLV